MEKAGNLGGPPRGGIKVEHWMWEDGERIPAGSRMRKGELHRKKSETKTRQELKTIKKVAAVSRCFLRGPMRGVIRDWDSGVSAVLLRVVCHVTTT